MEKKGRNSRVTPAGGQQRVTPPTQSGVGTGNAINYQPQQQSPQRGKGGARGGRGGRGGGQAASGGGYKPVPRPKCTRPYEGLEQVISGGQTGADRGGLIAAKHLGIPTGGTAPSNFLTEKGPDISLKREFKLKEGHCDYADRTKMNADNSDGTLAIRLQPGNGTDKTIGWCHWGQWTYGKERAQSKDQGWRPVLVITDISEEKLQENVRAIQAFIIRNKIRVLNVAGHRESTAGVTGFGDMVTQLLIAALEDVAVGKWNGEEISTPTTTTTTTTTTDGVLAPPSWEQMTESDWMEVEQAAQELEQHTQHGKGEKDV